jgi:hypothetical protein
VQLLAAAYAKADGVLYDDQTHTLAVAGTRTIRDWLTDAAFLFGAEGTMQSRFDTASVAVSRYHPQRIIGHSLGGAVASQYTGTRGVTTVGYDPYVLPWRGQVDRAYSDALDPVSMLAQHNTHLPLGRDGHWLPHALGTLS